MIAVIWDTVFTFPRNDTATLLLLPMRAIHSRNAEIAISRPMMITAMKPSSRPIQTSMISAVATISLSATGSRKAPKGDTLVQRARQVAIQPVGDCGERKNRHGRQVLVVVGDPVVRHVVHRDQHRDHQDAQPGEEIREVDRHEDVSVAADRFFRRVPC